MRCSTACWSCCTARYVPQTCKHDNVLVTGGQVCLCVRLHHSGLSVQVHLSVQTRVSACVASVSTYRVHRLHLYSRMSVSCTCLCWCRYCRARHLSTWILFCNAFRGIILNDHAMLATLCLRQKRWWRAFRKWRLPMCMRMLARCPRARRLASDASRRSMCVWAVGAGSVVTRCGV